MKLKREFQTEKICFLILEVGRSGYLNKNDQSKMFAKCIDPAAGANAVETMMDHISDVDKDRDSVIGSDVGSISNGNNRWNRCELYDEIKCTL